MVYSQWLDRQPETDLDTFAMDPVSIARSFEFQGDEAGLHQHLRVQANAWFARIIRAEFEQSAPLEVIGAALSAVAAGALESALSHYWPVLVQRFGTPRDSQAQPVSLVALGMGKLGGYELNLSSDIDLIFVHSADGMTDGAKSTSNEDFFSRLIKKVAPALDSLTGYGRVFQVDLRLRPWGCGTYQHFS